MSLEGILEPQSVAVIGASRNKEKWGHIILKNIIKCGYSGNIYAINPKETEILGIKCYPSVLDVPDDIDLAVIVIPAPLVNKVVEECGKKGVKGLVITSAGFSEVGKEGSIREKKVMDLIKKYKMRLIGPNTLGIVNTYCNLNASLMPKMPERGKISFITQSGTLGLALMDSIINIGLGLNKVVSVGNKADVQDSDLLQFLDTDINTNTIIMYVEGIKNGREFMEVAKKIKKPIIAIKSGRTKAGRKAAFSHTGSMAGSDDIYTAAFKQVGVIRAKTIEELFDVALALSTQPLPKDNKVAILTSGGGAGILAADYCEEVGLEVVNLSDNTRKRLEEILPPCASSLNPIDTVGFANYKLFKNVIEILLSEEKVSGLIVIYTHAALVDPLEIANAILDTKYTNKPIIACWIGGEDLNNAIKLLKNNNIPTYSLPESAASAIASLVTHKNYLRFKV